VRIVYKGGAASQFPLTIGSTLECEDKLLSKSKAMLLHPTDDPFLYYLAIEGRPEEIERVELRRDPKDPGIVSIRGITCETDAKAENLLELPDLSPGAEEAAWIESHALSPSGPHLER